MEVRFCEPIKLSEWFSISLDKQPWNVDEDTYERSYRVAYQKHKTPIRERAPFAIDDTINAKIDYATKITEMNAQAGVYLLAARFPKPALYIGTACDPGGENIQRRISKHKIKLTGSNIGQLRRPPNDQEFTNGGVNHTKKWREFAPKRYTYFEGKEDACEDVEFSFAHLIFPENALIRVNHIAEAVERYLVRTAFNRVCDFMLKEQPALCLTARTNRRSLGDIRIFLGNVEITGSKSE